MPAPAEAVADASAADASPALPDLSRRTSERFAGEASPEAASPEAASPVATPPVPASAADAVAVIERIQESWRTFEVEGDPTGAAFAIVDAAAGEPIGMCGVDHWSNTDVVQFGYWLAAGARGRGFATRAVTLMTSWLFELGAARVFLTIQSDNAASAAVARRAGFTYEGTLRADGVWRGQRKDVEVFAMLPGEWPLGRDL